MSHEIRTPMNAILGFSEILNNKLANNSEYKPFIDGIIKGGNNLITLINDILDLSKIEAGRLEIKPEPVNLLKLIEDIKQIFSVKIKNKNLQFLLEIDKRLPNILLIDQTRIRQILFNLVGNAIKFTETGSVSIAVKIEGNTKPENKIDLFFEIKDTGIGIKQDQIFKIFEPFIQTEGQSNKYGGTGLGLPITKRLTEAMGGKITVKSAIGKGSTFRIHFKSITVANIQINNEKDKEQSSIINILFKKPKILLVDDIKSNREIVKYHLEEHNCEIYEAANGQEAVDFAKTYKPDLILMDIQMPILNGFEASKQIKQLDNITIIALTALVMKEQKEKYDKMFDDYLKKPVEIKDLIISLMKFLPYTKLEKTETQTEIKSVNYAEQFSAHIEKNGKLSNDFIHLFKTEIQPIYEELSDIMDMEECKKFAVKLINIGIKFKIDTFGRIWRTNSYTKKGLILAVRQL